MSRNIFIDCGAHMGQTIDYFKLSNTYKNNKWDIYSFEAITDLTKIINIKHPDINILNKAVWIQDGIIDFYQTKIKKQYLKNNDMIFGQGSSLIIEKKTGELDKENPIKLECIDLSNWIKNNFSNDDKIWLKIDIEGAEYEVLKHLIETNIISYIDKLFIEFHYEKINLDINIHNDIKNKLKTYNIDLIEDKSGQKSGDWFNGL
jgi:FkbM family methyltransferase